MLRRKRLPPELAPALGAFHIVVAELEPAKALLTEAVPTTRAPGRPLPDALHAYEAGLARAQAGMAAWRTPELEARWMACQTGLEAALERTRRARDDPIEPAGFEALLWLIEELLDPLDPFADAERAFLDLRR
jgi:hypothetical protein